MTELVQASHSSLVGSGYPFSSRYKIRAAVFSHRISHPIPQITVVMAKKIVTLSPPRI